MVGFHQNRRNTNVGSFTCTVAPQEVHLWSCTVYDCIHSKTENQNDVEMIESDWLSLLIKI